jgi:hypothetical protein
MVKIKANNPIINSEVNKNAKAYLKNIEIPPELKAWAKENTEEISLEK